ncbi:MAG: bifunctional riboflavin kinase/FAD synthetase [Ruminococcaceae bacterium]|nr:bifunctional riboflavin kinase/FAD synthetase [Oscillospiraceae bacterium]
MIIKNICDTESFDLGRVSLALGNFDGVHFAHARLIQKAKEIATSRMITAGERLLSAVFTFSDLKKPFLTTTDEKLEIFEKLGVDVVFLCPFESVKDMSPDDFVRDILVKKLSCAHAVCGFNYRFGKGAVGTADTLADLTSHYQIPCTIIGEITGVSSTKIREQVSLGRVEDACELLGRPFSISGKVIHGKGMGASFGYPTVNIALPDGKILPARGVYFTECEIDGKIYHSITNIGVCPTFGGENVVCENHLLDVQKDLYGQTATVYFLKFHRSEVAFPSTEELYAAVREDTRAARDFYLSKFQ